MTDEEARIRSYLVAQAAKLGPAAIIDKVRAATAELAGAAKAVPSARFGERPVAGEWSANEVLAHVVAADRYFGGAIRAVLDGDALPAVDDGRAVDGAPLRSADAWLAILDAQRTALFARVLAADPDARPDRSIAHPMFGTLTWRETLLFTRLHDLDHAGQLGKIRAAFA